jgi:hypothetical protein
LSDLRKVIHANFTVDMEDGITFDPSDHCLYWYRTEFLFRDFEAIREAREPLTRFRQTYSIDLRAMKDLTVEFTRIQGEVKAFDEWCYKAGQALRKAFPLKPAIREEGWGNCSKCGSKLLASGFCTDTTCPFALASPADSVSGIDLRPRQQGTPYTEG